MSDRTFILLEELGAIALKYQQRIREIREGRRGKVKGIGWGDDGAIAFTYLAKM